tara:strand:+ start:475 stop:690 length:216 start_codon:yes stop_codon:yes gene_type:complete
MESIDFINALRDGNTIVILTTPRGVTAEMKIIRAGMKRVTLYNKHTGENYQEIFGHSAPYNYKHEQYKLKK